MKTSEIQIRDPYIYVDKEERAYYMFGTTDKDCWHGPGQGFDCYKSKDLQAWEGWLPRKPLALIIHSRITPLRLKTGSLWMAHCM